MRFLSVVGDGIADGVAVMRVFCVLEFETEAGETGSTVYFFFSHKSMKSFTVAGPCPEYWWRA
jgi:hypothetical protein